MRNQPKPLSSIANGLNFQARYEAPREFELPPQAIAIVNNLFNDLKGICTAWQHTFTDVAIEQAAKKQWVQALFENDVVNQHQINIGMKKARKLSKPWFPSSGEFIEWCKPSLEDYGLLPVDQALRIWIDRKSKSYPAIYAAAQATGSWALKSMKHKDLLSLFSRNYEIACNRVIAGEDLSNEIPLALPPKVFVPVPATNDFKTAREKLKQTIGADS